MSRTDWFLAKISKEELKSDLILQRMLTETEIQSVDAIK